MWFVIRQGTTFLPLTTFNDCSLLTQTLFVLSVSFATVLPIQRKANKMFYIYCYIDTLNTHSMISVTSKT